MGKNWYTSKTIGLGALLAALGLAILQLSEFQAVIEQLPAEYQGIAALILGIVVVVLRHFTTEPLTTNKKSLGQDQSLDN